MKLTTNKHKAAWPLAAASVLAFVLAGCASIGASTPEEAVTKRANAYWAARASGDYAKAYDLLSPSYRKLRTQEQFRGQFGSGAAIKDGKVVKVECEVEKCSVRIKITATPALMNVRVGTISTLVDETWLLEDGRWWRHQGI